MQIMPSLQEYRVYITGVDMSDYQKQPKKKKPNIINLTT